MAHRLYPHSEARLAKLRGEDEVLRLSLIEAGLSFPECRVAFLAALVTCFGNLARLQPCPASSVPRFGSASRQPNPHAQTHPSTKFGASPHQHRGLFQQRRPV